MRKNKGSGDDTAETKRNITFVHLDLGVGGAERLVVDAALALKCLGHNVQFVTTHHDESHCFPETADGSFPVTTVCDWMPRSVFGIFYAVCSYFRMIAAALYIVCFSDMKPDIVVCDQVSACIPFLKLGKHKVVYYCHFPDLMLTDRKSFLKKLYRWPVDRIEEWTTGMADVVLVNSHFTGRVFREAFPSLKDIPIKVVYPTVGLALLDSPLEGTLEDVGIRSDGAVFLSLNRYERKKNVGLAIHALGLVREQAPAHLIVAGGYDQQCRENVEHYEELRTLAKKLGLEDHVTFLRSPTDKTKQLLLHSCRAVIYTPEREHFGIVPLEAMYMRRAVVACDSGGPTETVGHEETGYLCKPEPGDFAQAMVRLAKDRSLAQEMGISGRERVLALFSRDRFMHELANAIDLARTSADEGHSRR
ncbi:alpha-1,3/1,6-mannosyltransferase ALG2-like [Ornithodoros turicata]|uniref:alpha-1,3/1,6-mannosyltransferase ALG2-like n=1 Tax=Ornithodoros turicata TaxID=34597 RepID=UPI003139D570